MEREKELPQRKPTRLQNFDYSAAGIYFITICTENRREILSRIVGSDVLDAPKIVGSDVLGALRIVGSDVLDAPQNIKLLPHGKIAEKYIHQLSDFYEDIKVDGYVIMPNHIHLLLFVLESRASSPSPTTKQHSTVSRFVSTLKRFCNKEYGENIWQRYFYDHIIRNQEDYEKHVKYIYENPMRWYYEEK